MSSRWDDPEYRKQHGEKMKAVQREIKRRKRKNAAPPKEKVVPPKPTTIQNGYGKDIINWVRLKNLVWDLQPEIRDLEQKKFPIPKYDKKVYEDRDKGVCYICGKNNPYGSSNLFCRGYGSPVNLKHSHLHHVVPNGSAEPSNVVTLCTHCHQVVHQLMYIEGTWRYARPI